MGADSTALVSRGTQFGFQFGAALVERAASHKEAVTVMVTTPKGSLQIYVTKTGKIRVYSNGHEWKCEGQDGR